MIRRSLPSFSRSVCRRLSPPSPASGRTQIPQQRLAVRGGDHTSWGTPWGGGAPFPPTCWSILCQNSVMTESNPVTSLEPQVSPPLKLGLAQIISAPRSKSDDLWFKVLIFFLTQKHSQTSRNGNNQHGAQLFRKPRGVCHHTDLTVTLGGLTDSKSQKGDPKGREVLQCGELIQPGRSKNGVFPQRRALQSQPFAGPSSSLHRDSCSHPPGHSSCRA